MVVSDSAILKSWKAQDEVRSGISLLIATASLLTLAVYSVQSMKFADLPTIDPKSSASTDIQPAIQLGNPSRRHLRASVHAGRRVGEKIWTPPEIERSDEKLLIRRQANLRLLNDMPPFSEGGQR
jgi:hypothetical protein